MSNASREGMEENFPSLWEGLGEGLRDTYHFVFEGSVNHRVTGQNLIEEEFLSRDA